MQLTNKAINKITLQARNRLAVELKCSVPTVDRWIKKNEVNGDLTKTIALQVISEETGLAYSQILEDKNSKRVAKVGL
jgi:hypothetical protein